MTAQEHAEQLTPELLGLRHPLQVDIEAPTATLEAERVAAGDTSEFPASGVSLGGLWWTGTLAMVGMYVWLVVAAGLSPASAPGFTVLVAAVVILWMVRSSRMRRYYKKSPHTAEERHVFERRGF